MLWTARVAGMLVALLLVAAAPRPAAAQFTSVLALDAKMDPLVAQQALRSGRSRVIVTTVSTLSSTVLLAPIVALGGTVTRTLPLLGALVVDLPNASLTTLASSPLVARVSLDRRIGGSMERTGATIGATTVRQTLGYDGAGVGVAIIDSGVSATHDDLAPGARGPRVDHFVDVVAGRTAPYDDHGHGTHVAGIVAGNGSHSERRREGIAPGARLVVLKVLDGQGRGCISDVIAALDYVVSNRTVFNIRVVNLSVAAGVFESYDTDPLTIAAKRVVEAGIVVVAAAGNAGRNPDGRAAYGGVMAPGNAPWVLTVGASSHNGTTSRDDDTMGAFSSRGPTRVDYGAKPDLVAPGVGIESLSEPDSTLYTTKAHLLLPGVMPADYLPYLSLSGTSMASPVVAGTVALMLQANPALTPNQVKAILQYTAQVYSAYDPLTEGAGFLNAAGAVSLAHYFRDTSAGYPSTAGWSRRLIWGNLLVSGGLLSPSANAWPTTVTWGALTTRDGRAVEWGVRCAVSPCGSWGLWVPWQAPSQPSLLGRVYTSNQTTAQNVVWGSRCGGADCDGPWTVEAANDDASVVWGTSDEDESVVWGTNDDESVVWGTNCDDDACEPPPWN